jgi:serine/threonine protein kinase
MEEGVERVVLTDFGLARAVDDIRLTRTDTLVGTPQYMSPEQTNDESLDFRTDLFSLGSVLYETSTGRPAFQALTRELLPLRTCELSGLVVDRLIDFVRSAEVKLIPDERLPLSSEILESSFGLYKQLEGQNSKGGFTSLLASFGALLQPATAESIRRDLSRVPVQAMRTWGKTNLKTTVGSKRNAAYTESTKAA